MHTLLVPQAQQIMVLLHRPLLLEHVMHVAGGGSSLFCLVQLPHFVQQIASISRRQLMGQLHEGCLSFPNANNCPSFLLLHLLSMLLLPSLLCIPLLLDVNIQSLSLVISIGVICLHILSCLQHFIEWLCATRRKRQLSLLLQAPLAARITQLPLP